MHVNFTKFDYIRMAEEIEQITYNRDGEAIDYEFSMDENIVVLMEVTAQCHTQAVQGGYGGDYNDHETLIQVVGKSLSIKGWSIGHLMDDAVNITHNFCTNRLQEIFEND